MKTELELTEAILLDQFHHEIQDPRWALEPSHDDIQHWVLAQFGFEID